MLCTGRDRVPRSSPRVAVKVTFASTFLFEHNLKIGTEVISLIMAVQNSDIIILFERALLGKNLTGFGVDGFGQYGSCTFAQTYKVVEVDAFKIGSYDSGFLILTLDGYDSGDYGDLVTDQNFLLSVRNCLAQEHINRGSVSWAPPNEQGNRKVVLNIKPSLLDL